MPTSHRHRSGSSIDVCEGTDGYVVGLLRGGHLPWRRPRVVHSEICAVPAERLTREYELLTGLPSLRASIGAATAGVTRKVDRLSWVRFGSARYSVPTRLIGSTVQLRVGEGWLAVAEPAIGAVVADHALVAPARPACSMSTTAAHGWPSRVRRYAPRPPPSSSSARSARSPGRFDRVGRGREHPSRARAGRVARPGRRARQRGSARSADPRDSVSPLANRRRALDPRRSRSKAAAMLGLPLRPCLASTWSSRPFCLGRAR
ncbi:MAG: Mu transposase domain-containing protein [Pseudonocardiaceae bacterium]